MSNNMIFYAEPCVCVVRHVHGMCMLYVFLSLIHTKKIFQTFSIITFCFLLKVATVCKSQNWRWWNIDWRWLSVVDDSLSV